MDSKETYIMNVRLEKKNNNTIVRKKITIIFVVWLVAPFLTFIFLRPSPIGSVHLV